MTSTLKSFDELKTSFYKFLATFLAGLFVLSSTVLATEDNQNPLLPEQETIEISPSEIASYLNELEGLVTQQIDASKSKNQAADSKDSVVIKGMDADLFQRLHNAISNPRDRLAALLTGMIISWFPENFDDAFIRSVMETAIDFSSRGQKSPFGIGIFFNSVAWNNNDTPEDESDDFTYYTGDLDELKTFLSGIVASKGLKKSEVIGKLTEALTPLVKAAMIEYQSSLQQGPRKTDGNAEDPANNNALEGDSPKSSSAEVTISTEELEKNVKIAACLIAEEEMDAPFFRRPCRLYGPYAEIKQARQLLLNEFSKQGESSTESNPKTESEPPVVDSSPGTTSGAAPAGE